MDAGPQECGCTGPGCSACWLVFGSKCQDSCNFPGLAFCPGDKRLTLSSAGLLPGDLSGRMCEQTSRRHLCPWTACARLLPILPVRSAQVLLREGGAQATPSCPSAPGTLAGSPSQGPAVLPPDAGVPSAPSARRMPLWWLMGSCLPFLLHLFSGQWFRLAGALSAQQAGSVTCVGVRPLPAGGRGAIARSSSCCLGIASAQLSSVSWSHLGRPPGGGIVFSGGWVHLRLLQGVGGQVSLYGLEPAAEAVCLSPDPGKASSAGGQGAPPGGPGGPEQAQGASRVSHVVPWPSPFQPRWEVEQGRAAQ